MSQSDSWTPICENCHMRPKMDRSDICEECHYHPPLNSPLYRKRYGEPRVCPKRGCHSPCLDYGPGCP